MTLDDLITKLTTMKTALKGDTEVAIVVPHSFATGDREVSFSLEDEVALNISYQCISLRVGDLRPYGRNMSRT